MKQLSKYQEQTYALVRIVAGFMFSLHGAQKILGLFGGPGIGSLNVQMMIGGIIELVGGLLIMIGFQTRTAAFITSGTMAVAYIQFHWKFAFSAAFFPIVNMGELALLYSFLFLFIACKGAGMWAIDKD
jgi:putative oxidoreductase